MFSLYLVSDDDIKDCLFDNVLAETILNWFKEKHGKQVYKQAKQKMSWLTHSNDTTWVYVNLCGIKYSFNIWRN